VATAPGLAERDRQARQGISKPERLFFHGRILRSSSAIGEPFHLSSGALSLNLSQNHSFFSHAHSFRIQPSGILHIGNYFGMIQPAIALQEEGECFISSRTITRLPACATRQCFGKTPATSPWICSRAGSIRNARHCFSKPTCRR
jgi:hypothetical protein